MLDISKNGAPKGEASAIAPGRTTFPDGRMTTKEAWNLCRALCDAAGLEAPTLRTFRWHLKHANFIRGEKVRNPFSGPKAEKVYAITEEAVRQFVTALAERGDEVRVVEEEPRPGVTRRTPPPAAKGDAPAPKPKKAVELDATRALKFLHDRVPGKCELNGTTFGFYLAYDVIPSRFEGRQRMVRRDDLEAFLELVPDGVYANHIEYETESKPDDLSMRDAYAYYADVDPAPITLNSFRSIVAAGIVRPVRTANSPKAPVVGFRRQEIAGFLALRERILKKNSKTTATKAFLARKAAEKDGDNLVAKAIEEALKKAAAPTEAPVQPEAKPAAKPAAKPSKKPKPRKKRREAPDIPERRDLTEPPFPETVEAAQEPAREEVKRLTVAEGYEYYRSRCKNPYSYSWFRRKVSQDVFDVVRVDADNPKGMRCLVGAASIDAFLDAPAVGPRGPQYLAVETAYHQLSDVIPATLSLLQFKRLVKQGIIRSARRQGVTKVKVPDVRRYFKDVSSPVAALGTVAMGSAYAYYSSRVADPVSRSHFARWCYDGVIAGSRKGDDGWEVPVEGVDAFVAKHPSGRVRVNRNSVASKVNRLPEQDSGPVVVSDDRNEEVRVAVSISDYSGPAELQEAIAMLAQQGFKVDVRP